MVLSTFLLKMSLIYVALYFKQQQWTLFQRKGLRVCKMTRTRVSACRGHAGQLGRYRNAVLCIITLRAEVESEVSELGGRPQGAMHREFKVCHCQ